MAGRPDSITLRGPRISKGFSVRPSTKARTLSSSTVVRTGVGSKLRPFVGDFGVLSIVSSRLQPGIGLICKVNQECFNHGFGPPRCITCAFFGPKRWKFWAILGGVLVRWGA